MDVMEVCPSCGTIAPESYDACKICGASFEQGRPKVTPPAGGLMLVRLCGEFDCRSCGGKVALNHFTLEGYRCGSCGIKQTFDWDLWEQIVTHAHNTADLTGFARPNDADEDFWNAFVQEEGDDLVWMFRAIGRNRSTLTKGNSCFGGLEFEMDVSPGNPICSECGAPLIISADHSALTVSCNRCDDRKTYALSEENPEAAGLVATICGESRTDAPR